MSSLRKYIREALISGFERDILEENSLSNVKEWFKEKGESAIEQTKDFFVKLKQEWGETEEGAIILKKIVMGEEISEKENAALKEQIKDLTKGIPLLALVALPGGSIATVALVKLAKKVNIDLMPSAFREE